MEKNKIILISPNTSIPFYLVSEGVTPNHVMGPNWNPYVDPSKRCEGSNELIMTELKSVLAPAYKLTKFPMWDLVAPCRPRTMLHVRGHVN